ncbi:MAG: hypothetical protein WAM14_19540 [Candidatus Nitrosopolaris sp.]
MHFQSKGANFATNPLGQKHIARVLSLKGLFPLPNLIPIHRTDVTKGPENYVLMHVQKTRVAM